MTALLSNLHTLKATHTYLLSEHRVKKLFDVDHSFFTSFFFFFFACGGVPAHYNTKAKSKSWKVDFLNNIYIFTKLKSTVLYLKESS